jgi:hypothetical protein
MPLPAWKIGDTWKYALKAPGAEMITTMTLLREAKLENAPTYVIRRDSVESHYSKDTLEHIAAIKDGILINKRLNPSYDISWPLVFGKTWQNSYTWENSVDGSRHKIDLSMVVKTVETIKVPAGSFVAAHVQGYDNNSGRLIAEYWYSPVVKWLVKSRTYDVKVPLLEEELISVQTN